VLTDKFKHGQPIKVEDALQKELEKSKKKGEPQFAFFFQLWRLKGRHFSCILAERTGLEPATPGVTGRYSNQLNYRSKISAVCICGGADGTRTRDPRRDRPVF
jgi:hypothetical protein